MKPAHSFVVPPEEKASLRRRVARYEREIPFSLDPELAVIVASLGIQQEVGTQNDEMARFVFDADTGTAVPRESLKAELIRYGGTHGVRIRAEGHVRLDFRFPGIQSLLHPGLSRAADGTLEALVVFPSIVAAFLRGQGVEPVIVVPWALNTIFGGFHPSDGFYQTNMWELLNVDAIRYASLVEKRQLAFLGTHDLVAHAAGTRGEAWDELSKLGTRVRETLEAYIAGVSSPNVSSLILPYVSGIMLDDLAQPPCYGAESRLIVLEEVLKAIDGATLPPAAPLQLLKFPELYARLIDLARFGEISRVRSEAPVMVRGLVAEIARTSIDHTAPSSTWSNRKTSWRTSSMLTNSR